MTLNVETGQVYEAHPVADLFPMLPDDELADLAESIKQRGLDHPIVIWVDEDGQRWVLDGRNRLAACHLAGVQPSFEVYEGDDPEDYALRVNGQRRSMTKSQKALVAAARLLSKQDPDDGEYAATARALGVSRSLITQAISIRTWARDLADRVMLTGTGFAEARDVAAERQEAKRVAEAGLSRLHDYAPDLAELVDEERLSVDDAIELLDSREEKAEAEERQRAEEAAAKARRVSESLRMAVNTLTKAFGSDELREQAAAIYVDAEYGSEVNQNVSADDLAVAADICRDLAKRWESR